MGTTTGILKVKDNETREDPRDTYEMMTREEMRELTIADLKAELSSIKKTKDIWYNVRESAYIEREKIDTDIKEAEAVHEFLKLYEVDLRDAYFEKTYDPDTTETVKTTVYEGKDGKYHLKIDSPFGNVKGTANLSPSQQE